MKNDKWLFMWGNNRHNMVQMSVVHGSNVGNPLAELGQTSGFGGSKNGKLWAKSRYA